jgi:cell division protein YceG involved in septum cleavage
MHPRESEFFYFVSDNNGHHRFSRNAAEHEKNVAAYRKATASQR